MTAEGNSGRGPCVVVVGDPGGRFVQATVQVARERQIDAVACADVYSALVTIAGQAGRRLWVVGTIKELMRENGSFFSLASAHAVRCGCLLDHQGTVRREHLLAALRGGAALLGDPQDVRAVFQEWLAAPGGHRPARVVRDESRAERLGRETPGSAYEDLRATAAELRALLG